jgi:hypothetical protein
VSALAFPRRQLGALEALAASVLEKRGDACPGDTLARDLLAGFHGVCMQTGLDGVLRALEQAFPPLDTSDGTALAEDPRLRAALASRLGNRDEFDPRGPRSAKPRQLAACLLATLALTPFDPPDRTLTLPGELRDAAFAALAEVIEAELAPARLRASICEEGRRRCEPRYLAAFEQMSAQLDERGLRVTRQLKLPIDAVQAVQRALAEARAATFERAAAAAIDRAWTLVARGSAEALDRIDRPISYRLTPREVAIGRVNDPRVPRAAEPITRSLFDSLTELAELAWSPSAPVARAYSPRETYAVGEVVEHPKFGRGTVQAAAAQRVEVEFAEGWHTLVHGRAGS